MLKVEERIIATEVKPIEPIMLRLYLLTLV